MGLEALPDEVLQLALIRSAAEDAARISCTSQRCKAIADDDRVWSLHCSRDFAVTSKVDLRGNPCRTFKETYVRWKEEFAIYPLSVVKRGKQCWDALKKWIAINFPEGQNFLGDGVSEEEVMEIENKLHCKLPITMRVLYRFCNGQNVPGDGSTPISGLFGSYSFYNHAVNVVLLPLEHILGITRRLHSEISLPNTSEFVVVAASAGSKKFSKKLFFLDCSDGRVYVGTSYFPKTGEMMPCVPDAFVDAFLQDGFLLWLEEYVRQLEAGMFSVKKQHVIKGISLFPEKRPLCSRAVTNGVEVLASAVFVPESSILNDGYREYVFSYQIRLRLLNGDNASRQNPLRSCQLLSRHWIIRANGSVIDEVHGEAVIGKYPLLQPGGDAFVYESCSYMPSYSGSMEGHFKFVPGSLAKPEGLIFDVAVAEFPLQVPQYIF